MVILYLNIMMWGAVIIWLFSNKSTKFLCKYEHFSWDQLVFFLYDLFVF